MTEYLGGSCIGSGNKEDGDGLFILGQERMGNCLLDLQRGLGLSISGSDFAIQVFKTNDKDQYVIFEIPRVTSVNSQKLNPRADLDKVRFFRVQC